MIKIANPFTLSGLSQGLRALENRSPKITLGLAIFFTFLGYVLLALPVLLLLTGLFKVPAGISAADSFGAWLGVLVWIGITGVCAAISYTLLRIKMAMPSGLGLKEDKAPRMYELLDEMRQTYKLPKLHRVTVHDHFELELIPVPRFGLPFLTMNVLYIGLPVLQALSPMQFRGALARRLGQYSAAHNKLTHLVYRWRQFCQQYQRAYAKQTSPLYLPLKWFFNLYTPFMLTVTASTARQDELQADVYALELLNDSEMADFILRSEVVRVFLKTKYWPKIHSMLRKSPANPEHLPHINMPKVVRNALTENEFAQTMKDLINQEPQWQDNLPDLHTRLENIGQTRLDMPPPVMETAAQRYLGDASAAVIKLLDKQWLAKYGKVRAKKSPPPAPPTPGGNAGNRAASKPATTASNRTVSASVANEIHTPLDATFEFGEDSTLPEISTEAGATITVSERKHLAALKKKAGSGRLSDNEAWELASLTEKLEDKSLAITLYQQVLKQNPNHAKTLFAVGRILLSKQDASGVKALERAMELDKGCVAQGCWMLAKYFKATGDEAQSRKYLERAANVSAAA